MKQPEEIAEVSERSEADEPVSVERRLNEDEVQLARINRLKRALGTLPSSQGGEAPRVEKPPESVVERPAEAAQKVMPIVRIPEKTGVPEGRAAGGRLEPGTGIPVEMQRFTEEFTRNFLGGVTGAFQEMHTLLAEGRGRAAALNEEFGNHIASLREQLEACSGLLADMQSMMEGIESRQEALEKRMEVQAGAIRAIHSAVQEREDRFNKLLLTLETAPAPRNGSDLPDSL